MVALELQKVLVMLQRVNSVLIPKKLDLSKNLSEIIKSLQMWIYCKL